MAGRVEPRAEEGSRPRPPRVLGLVFLTAFLDLAGFSILFPLFPDLLEHYVALEGPASAVGRLAARLAELSGDAAGGEFLVHTLFGGLLGSVYSLLQFAFAPIWGSVSDRYGRRSTLLVTLAGTALAHIVWVFAGLPDLGVRRASLLYFLYMVAFSAAESTLVFLAVERFAYTPRQNAWIFVYIGVLIALVQGGLVRRVAPRAGERRLVQGGSLAVIASFAAVAFAASVPALYAALGLMALGSAFLMPCLSSLVSRYAPAARQGLALGTFRSLRRARPRRRPGARGNDLLAPGEPGPLLLRGCAARPAARPEPGTASASQPGPRSLVEGIRATSTRSWAGGIHPSWSPGQARGRDSR